MSDHNLVLIRHGESPWNKKGIFTGWVDVGLTEYGEAEARRAGQLLRRRGFKPDRVFTSVLNRAIKTAWLSLEAMDMMWLPITYDWRLNERHYGALQGKNKKALAAKLGDEQIHQWRRSYEATPPPMSSKGLVKQISAEACGLTKKQMPRTESLKDTYLRVIPYWRRVIRPALRRGEKVMVVAHGNSLRALVKHLENISDEQIPYLELPTGKPLWYKID